MQQMTQDATVSLDWKALQKALVFTKRVYRKPFVRRPPRRSSRNEPDVIDQQSAPAALAPTATAVISLYRHVDAFGETDERLLPWSRD
jgi:hypothetical protein